MTPGDDPIGNLRQALEFSPDNLPLRLHVVNLLLGKGRGDEAEQLCRQGLATTPDEPGLKLSLAQAFYQQGRYGEALVVVEDLLKARDAPAAGHVLHARLLLAEGDVRGAVAQYRRAIDIDPACADAELAETLGVKASSSDEHDSPVVDGRQRATWEGDRPAYDANVERPRIGFADVGGMEELKEAIRLKIIHPLAHPELYRAYGKPIGGGILLYGPPGCGKTYLARATAGEVQAAFLSVAINDVLDMWIGQSERNLHDLFENARSHAPCVLFFDEVDALGASRSEMRGHTRQLINQFLAELDGAERSNDGVLVLGATNAPWHLDTAFRRPGRFDRIIFVPPPDLPARAAILRILCRGKPVETIDYDVVARKTEQFSGADLKAVLDVAIERKLQQSIHDLIPKPLSTKDLLAALPSVRPTTKDWFATARNYALYSNQGGLYDDVLKYLKLS